METPQSSSGYLHIPPSPSTERKVPRHRRITFSPASAVQLFSAQSAVCQLALPPRNVCFGVGLGASSAAFSVVVPVIYHDPLCSEFKRRLQLCCIVHSLCAGLQLTDGWWTWTGESERTGRTARAFTQPISCPYFRQEKTGGREKPTRRRRSSRDSIWRSVLSRRTDWIG